MEKCKVCGKEFKTIRDLLIHCERIKGDHPNCKEYKFLFFRDKEDIVCKLCKAYFKSFSSLFKHISRFEKIKRDEYFLKFPDQEFLYKESLKKFILKNIEVDKMTNCWNWVKTKPDKDGYSAINGISSHRLSYELFIDKIPNKMLICHICDNPRCINPDHLYCGTPQTNMNDMKNRGRSLKGNKNPSKRLEIRNKISKNNPMNKIENRLKISIKTKGISRPKYNYELINQNEIIFNTKNLFKFCKENSLDYRKFLEMSNGVINEFNGWKCRRRVRLPK